MWVVENSLGQLGRVHWEETEDPSLLLLSSCYPSCRSFLATAFAFLHPGLSPLLFHLVPRFVPGITFHSLPPQHIHVFHIGLSLTWLFLDQANNHTACFNSACLNFFILDYHFTGRGLGITALRLVSPFLMESTAGNWISHIFHCSWGFSLKCGLFFLSSLQCWLKSFALSKGKSPGREYNLLLV